MRLISIAAAVLVVTGCAGETAVTVCDHADSHCKSFSTIGEANLYSEQRRKEDFAAASSLDIDFDKCAVVVLAAEIGSQPSPSKRIYISIIGEDPSPDVLAGLAAVGINAEAKSKRPPEPATEVMVTSSDVWIFSIAKIRPRWTGGYIAVAGYMCGSLCAGSSEYRLSKADDSCIVDSRRPLWSA